MLEFKMTTIRTSEREYPIICTFNVLEYMQENYKTIADFQTLVSGMVKKEKPDSEGKQYDLTPINISALLDGITVMVNEGIDILNTRQEEKASHVTRKETGVILREAGVPLADAAGIVLDELTMCIMPKNLQPAQSANQKEMKKQQSILRGFFMWARRFFTIRKKK